MERAARSASVGCRTPCSSEGLRVEYGVSDLSAAAGAVLPPQNDVTTKGSHSFVASWRLCGAIHVSRGTRSRPAFISHARAQPGDLWRDPPLPCFTWNTLHSISRARASVDTFALLLRLPHFMARRESHADPERDRDLSRQQNAQISLSSNDASKA